MHDKGDNMAGYWVQKDVTAHGESWVAYSDADSEPVIGECESRMDDDADDVHEGSTSEPEATGSHARTAFSLTQLDAASYSAPTSQRRRSSPRTKIMAPKTYFWISLWYVYTEA